MKKHFYKVFGTVTYGLLLTDEQYAKLHLEAVKKDIGIKYIGKQNGKHMVKFIKDNVFIKNIEKIKDFDTLCLSVDGETEEEKRKNLCNMILEEINKNNKFKYINLENIELYSFKQTEEETFIYNMGIVFEKLDKEKIIKEVSKKVIDPDYLNYILEDKYFTDAFETIKKVYFVTENKEDNIKDFYFKDIENCKKEDLYKYETNMKNLLEKLCRVRKEEYVLRHLYTQFVKGTRDYIPREIKEEDNERKR